MNHKLLFNFALKLGRIMLENGAETYRVEDTMERILKTSNFEVAETFVTPTGIFATFDDPSIDMITQVKRTRRRTLHLHRISAANELSRNYCKGKISLEDAWEEIKAIENLKLYHPLTTVGAIGFSAAFFSLMLGGSLTDFVVALVVGICLGFTIHFLNKSNVSPYFICLLGGIVIGALAKGAHLYLLPNTHLDLIIAGTLMPLVPGVAVTNGIMDTIRGDLVSGISRSVDAVVTAAFIAIGVGISLNL